MTSSRSFVQVIVGAIVAPYLLGYLISPSLISEDHFQRLLTDKKTDPPTVAPQEHEHVAERKSSYVVSNSECDDQLKSILSKELLEGVEINVHHNGVADPCGTFTADWDLLLEAAQTFQYCPQEFDKYDVESLFTRFLQYSLPKDDCAADDLDDPLADGILGFCDRGAELTPVLSDHHNLVRIPETDTFPCHFHTREGLRISSFQIFNSMIDKAKSQCTDGEAETCEIPAVSLYAVPAGRIFMLAPKYIGETFEMTHVEGALGKPISLTVMSVSPRVFDVHNFFSREESADLVTRALAERSESHRIKRSTTGAGSANVNSQRTSESGFDTNGRTAIAVKKRCFETLGMDTYIEGHSDGLQILRYNKTTAYIPHMDYLDDPHQRLRHNYDSYGQGGNRLATILLYMSDLGDKDGGETVFTEAWPVGQPEDERVPLDRALKELRASGDAEMLKKGSWEESMVAKCRSRLAVKPKSGRAVLFYSQHPNGEEDKSSLHGGCPVLHGEKWAANLWFWNTIRDGFAGNPVNEHVVQKEEKENAQDNSQYEQKQASFFNEGKDPKLASAELFFQEETFWSKLGHGDPPAHVNTYEGHEWTLQVEGRVVRKWLIGKEKTYRFVV